MNPILNLLMEMESTGKPMAFRPPASSEALAAAACRGLPRSQLLLWSVTDGCEINVPGTILYALEEARSRAAPDGLFPLGRMNFGDELFLTPQGQVLQLDHEDGTVFLDWLDLDAFLRDELSALREEG